MITTKELINNLQADTNLDEYFSVYEKEFYNATGKDILNELLVIRNLRVGDVAKKSGQGEYVYKVFNGERKPSRDILISISVGMQLTLEETQLLLRVMKYAVLDPRDKRDSIIIFGIKSGYDICRLNDLLNERNENEL